MGGWPPGDGVLTRLADTCQNTGDITCLPATPEQTHLGASPRGALGLILISALAATSVAACGLSGTEVAHDWALTGIDGAALSVVVAVGSSSCDHLDIVAVEEAPDEVTATAVVIETGGRTFPWETGACTADLVLEPVTSTLGQPLGGRTLSGCHPGDEELQDHFSSHRSEQGNQGPDDCATIIPDPW